MKDAAETMIQLCQQFVKACNNENSIDMLETIHQKIAKQDYSIRAELNSIICLGFDVECPKCKSTNVEIQDMDSYLLILRCKCRECEQFFIKDIEQL